MNHHAMLMLLYETDDGVSTKQQHTERLFNAVEPNWDLLFGRYPR
jgi:hypothetical protein